MLELQISDLEIAEDLKEPIWLGRTPDDHTPSFPAQLESILSGDSTGIGLYRSQDAVDTFFEDTTNAEQFIDAVILPNTTANANEIRSTGQVLDQSHAVMYLYDRETEVEGETIVLRDTIEIGDAVITKSEGFMGRYFVKDKLLIGDVDIYYLDQIGR